jgi:hypothetical protein
MFSPPQLMPSSSLRISDYILASFSRFSSSIRRILLYNISMVERSSRMASSFSASWAEMICV